MREKIVAGNWKMNKTFTEAEELMHQIADGLEQMEEDKVGVILCPPAIYLEMAIDISEESSFFVGAQNISEHESGAYTGEISAPMLASLNIDYCIIGHSERRKYFEENDELIGRKVAVAIHNNITPIYCCGEVLPERQAGNHLEVVKMQLEKAVFILPPSEFSNLIIAYEPVWAIGTGVNATPEQAQEMHAYIRRLIGAKYGQDIAHQMTILYGGSCNASNAGALFSQPDVDGGLIGGASLKAEEFLKIIQSV
ncbi:MAG: triose-phosphate isomerase [Bacteroidetes bacterium]|nr:triose-phosphate isomerase [Bacteroidota bacterium]